MKYSVLIMCILALFTFSGLGASDESPGSRTFGEDVAFLKAHTETIVLSAGKSMAAVCPAWQGRVMTSTTGGYEGRSFGWINYGLIASGEKLEQFNPVGGEDRFWLGPEGGQFSLYFDEGEPFDLEHWEVPPAIDTEAFDTLQKSRWRARFGRRVELVNYSGTRLTVGVTRSIRIWPRKDASYLLAYSIPEGVDFVAYTSGNRIQNLGEEAWTQETGALSIWILGMFRPSPETTVVIPLVPGPVEELGPIVNDSYFGKVPADRLKIGNRALFFKGDGLYRSKIGLSPRRALWSLGSYDARNNILTLVLYEKPLSHSGYVNSMWEIQDEPFSGDAVNSYNDGPPAPGAKPLGPFYELETSSPAAFLAPEESLLHNHTTMHFTGPVEELDALSRAVLGVSLAEIRAAFTEE